MPELIFCFVDIETDGPVPGENSMLSLGAVARDADNRDRGAFLRNLAALPGAQPEPDTLAWWRSQPEVFAEVTRDPEPPTAAMAAFRGWIKALPGQKIFAAKPLMFDALWVDWYLRRFADARLFKGPRSGNELFAGYGLDIPSFLNAAFALPFTEKPDYPPALFGNIPHSHRPLDDAAGHAELFFHAWRHARAHAVAHPLLAAAAGG